MIGITTYLLTPMHLTGAKNMELQRYFTFIWYLNDVPGPGGYTEFYDGTQIQPEEGQMIIFPSTHTFIHRGVKPPVGQDKYICTGWIYHPVNRG